MRRKARVKVVLTRCVTGTLALLVAVTTQAYLNKEVEARWNGYGSMGIAASNDDIATGSIASVSASDLVADPVVAPVAELKPPLTPALLLESEPARRGLLGTVVAEPDHDCPPAGPTTAAAKAPTEGATTMTGKEEERFAQAAAQVTPQITAEVTVTRAGTRQTVYTVVRERR